MEKEKIQRAYSEAQKEVEEKAIENVKIIIKRTLEELEKAKNDKAKIEEKIKYLKMDLEDIKDGKLSKITERQAIDEKARNYSVVIIKETEHHYHYPSHPYWVMPYRVFWNEVYCKTDNDTLNSEGFSSGDYTMREIPNTCECFTITNSLAKDFSSGAYTVGKSIINFR